MTVPKALKSAKRIAELQCEGDSVGLSQELGRARDVVFYLVGAIEGVADRHRDVRPLAKKARRLLGEEYQ